MAIGLGVVFTGYWIAYFGFCSLRGPGVGLLDLVIPGRTVVIPTSGGSPSSPSSGLSPGAKPVGPGGASGAAAAGSTGARGPSGAQPPFGPVGG